MSCTVSATWSRPVSSPCYTEHGQRCGSVLSCRIITVAMSRSGQLGLHCIIESNYSGLSTRLAGASVTRDRALDACDPSCVPGKLGLSLFLWSTARCGPWGMRQHQSSPLREARTRPCGSAGAHLDREARSGAEEHMAAPELSSQGGRAWCHGIRGSAGAHLSREVRSGAEEHLAAPELNSARRRGPRPRDTW
jgi:hypothetical protein